MAQAPALSIVNNCDDDKEVWLEVHNAGEIRPQVASVNPSGPYKSKPHQSQPVGNFLAAKNGFAVFLFAKGQPGSESLDRIDVKHPPATIVVAADRKLVRVLQNGEAYADTAPRLPVWLRWTLFGLAGAIVLGVVAFVIFKVVKQKFPGNSE